VQAAGEPERAPAGAQVAVGKLEQMVAALALVVGRRQAVAQAAVETEQASAGEQQTER